MRLHCLWVIGLVPALVLGCAAPGASPEGTVMPEQDPNPSRPAAGPAAPEGPPMPPLTEAEKHIIMEKGTETPFTGKYWNHFERGAYACRRCGALLYLSDSKFASPCGWPSFDDAVRGAVRQQPDADGRRTEILCA